MILYYVRHGDPIYHPNQLTALGERQAEAVARRLAVHGIDRIYSSPSNRARQTAEPLCQIAKISPEILDWSDEDRLYSEMVQSSAGGVRLDAMFVDEGFGSLDDNSLEQAFRALAELTEGNHIVGIISHVPALKEKIDKQIVVTKAKTGGSRVEIMA